RGHTLDVAAPHVAHREYARKTRFEQMWQPGERPPRGRAGVRRQIRSGLDEAFPVEGETSGQPSGVRLCTHHQEQVRDVVRGDLRRAVVTPADALQTSIPFERDDLGARSQDDI